MIVLAIYGVATPHVGEIMLSRPRARKPRNNRAICDLDNGIDVAAQDDAQKGNEKS